MDKRSESLKKLTEILEKVNKLLIENNAYIAENTLYNEHSESDYTAIINIRLS